jgi:hypothetical protein
MERQGRQFKRVMTLWPGSVEAIWVLGQEFYLMPPGGIGHFTCQLAREALQSTGYIVGVCSSSKGDIAFPRNQIRWELKIGVSFPKPDIDHTRLKMMSIRISMHGMQSTIYQTV